MVGSGNPFTLPTVHHDSLVRDSKMYLSSMALLPRSSEEERDSLTQPLPGSRTDNQSRKAANSRLSLKIPTLSPLSSPTATNKMSVPTPAKPTTNSVKLSIPPRSSLKSPPRSKKDQPTVPSRSDPPLPSPPPSPSHNFLLRFVTHVSFFKSTLLHLDTYSHLSVFVFFCFVPIIIYCEKPL